MNDNIDDWLNSLGINSSAPTMEEAAQPVPLEVHPLVPPDSPSPITISPNDFNDILADNGFQEPPVEEAEAEELDDEDYDEEEEGDLPDWEHNGQQYPPAPTIDEIESSPRVAQAMEYFVEVLEEAQERDLDAEEDAEWEERINSGELTPVEFDPASVADQEVHSHMPNGEVIDVPIIQEETQEVSNDAVEAFEVATADVPDSVPEPVIPLNSPTLLLNDSTSRFSGTEWYNEIQKARIILAGCGGIGSWTVLQLARMNPAALFMYDDDIVEIANMSGQLYSQEDVGKAKVDAMADMIRSYTTMRNIFAIKDKFKATSEAGDIMICGFDNMAARKVFYSKWMEHLLDKPEEELHKCIFLDGRLSIDCLQVFCITGDNTWAMEEYRRKYLFDDSEADATQCSLKQTSYLACMIGSVIVNLFTNFIANTLNPIIPYDLPFFTEYDAQNMIFKTVK